MLDPHVILPDARYGSPFHCSLESGDFCVSVSPLVSAAAVLPRGDRGEPAFLTRGKGGPLRSGGFWLKFVSPGGSNRVVRRKHKKRPKEDRTPDLVKCPSERKSSPRRAEKDSFPAPPDNHIRGLKASPPFDSNSPPRFTALRRIDEIPESRDLISPPFRSLLRSNLATCTDKKQFFRKLSCTVPENNNTLVHQMTPKSSTLPRNLKCSPKDASCWSPARGSGSSPWWAKVLSPLTPKQPVFKAPQTSPWTEGNLFEWVDGGDAKKSRGLSIRRRIRSPRPGDDAGATSDSNLTFSDHEANKESSSWMKATSERGLTQSESALDATRVGSWALSFEKLLADPVGLHTFAEFLKKEYSHENIYFWTACERYKHIAESEERRRVAEAVFARHLGQAASEPVNVDSRARQEARDALRDPDEFLFHAAQKQIFNLMKFDSYSRFLKSDLYNTCLSHERRGAPLPYGGGAAMDPDLAVTCPFVKPQEKTRSSETSDDSRRKSLLPWHRKDRSKSKDRALAASSSSAARRCGNGARRCRDGARTTSESSTARYDLSDSRTSLSSSDRALSRESITSLDAISLGGGADSVSLCRFVLPDRSNSVLALRPGQSVRRLVRQLLEKRRLALSDFNVALTKGNKVVDQSADCSVLSGLEVKVERLVLFGLQLPSAKTVIVKAKPHKSAADVLKPVLSRYGLKMDLMFIYTVNDVVKSVNLKSSVTDLDGQKLYMQTKEEVKEWSDPAKIPRRDHSLDQLTNKIFDEILRGEKSPSSFDDLGVMDFDAKSSKTEASSESSSLYCDEARRSSLLLDRSGSWRKSSMSRVVGESVPGPTSGRPGPESLGNADKSKQDDAELYEGLKRAQLFSLDDQRGTEINFELPDFLKTEPELHPAKSSWSTRVSSGGDCSYLSEAHPEVFGGPAEEGRGSDEDRGEGEDEAGGKWSADTTLVAAPFEPDHGAGHAVAATTGTESSSNKENLLPANNNNKITYNNGFQHLTKSAAVAPMTPPPPLPPKPSLGARAVEPPPRPPSRQSRALPDPCEEPSLHLAPLNRGQGVSGRCSVSFV